MALDIKPLSITSMFNNVKSFFQSQENNSRWRDLTTGSEGNFFMRMLANIVSVISSRVMVGRREQFHDTAVLMSSQIALAVNNGYPVFRGRNHRRKVRLTLDSNINMTIPALSVVGFYSDEYSIITLEEINPSKNALEEDKTIEFNVVIGALKEIQWQAKTSNLKKFIRHEQGISEDYMLFLDGTPVPTSKFAKDKINDKYYIYTNPYKSVTIEYLNNLSTSTHKYDNDSVFTLRYVELADMDTEELTADMFTIGEFESETFTSTFKPFEDIEDIKQNSPVYRERQNLIRSKADWKDAYKDTLPSFKEVTYRALTPTYTQISYIKDDHTLLSVDEENYIRDNIEPGRYFGRPFPDTEDPKRELTTLDITLGLVGSYKYEEDVKADVQAIIDKMFKNTLNQVLNIYDVEKELRELSYVKYARVSVHVANRGNFTRYRKGDVISETISYGDTDEITKIYRCKDILGKSGDVEPTWNIPDTFGENVESDVTTSDNELVWQCYKRLANMQDVNIWAANSYYAVGDWVYSNTYPNYVFKCITLLAKSGTAEPDIVEVEEGDFIEDGDLLLVCVPYSSLYTNWTSKGVHQLRDRINISGKSFEVVGFVGITSGATSIKVKSQVQDLYTIPVDVRDSVEEGPLYLDGDFRNYVKQGDLVQVSANLAKETNYEEVIDDGLTLSAVIAAEVKEYEEDEEEEESGGDEGSTTPVTTINTSIDIDMSNTMLTSTALSGKSAPDVSGVSVGDNVEDYQLDLEAITYNSELELRKNSKKYKLADQFNIPGVTTVSFEIIGFSSAGMSAVAQPHIVGKHVGDTVEDYQLLEVLIDYDASLPIRSNFTGYRVGAEFNVDDDTTASLRVIGMTDSGTDYDSLGNTNPSYNSETTIIEEDPDEGGDDSGDEGDNKEDKNANWKALKAMKEKMAQIQEWIISEANDTLRTPADVIAFYKTLGDGSRFTEEELDEITECYNEYNSSDERQIYLHMDQFGSTRKVAIEELTASEQLPEKSWLDINCVKYYNSDNELAYIDRYGTATVEADGTLTFSPDYTPMASAFAIQREDADGNVLKIFSIIKNDAGDYVVRETYTKTFITTVTGVEYTAYPQSSINRFLTRIDITTPVGFYMEGSTINFAYNTTCDGKILWEEVTDLENIKYEWNVYPSTVLNVDLRS